MSQDIQSSFAIQIKNKQLKNNLTQRFSQLRCQAEKLKIIIQQINQQNIKNSCQKQHSLQHTLNINNICSKYMSRNIFPWKVQNLLPIFQSFHQALSSSLIKHQIQLDNSYQFKQLLSTYENKINQLRIRLYNKGIELQQAEYNKQNFYTYENYAPDLNNVRKFFIESLHKDKIKKLLSEMHTLQLQAQSQKSRINQSSYNAVLHSISNYHRRNNSDATALIDKNEKKIFSKFLKNTIPIGTIKQLIQKIKQEDKRLNELNEKKNAYLSIFKLLDYEQHKLRLSFIKNGGNIRNYLRQKKSYNKNQSSYQAGSQKIGH